MTGDYTDAWKLYEKGVDHHSTLGLYRKCEMFHRFFIGDQWHGLKNDGEELPIFNFIKPVGKYKISMIAQNVMSIVYSAMGGEREEISHVCELLNGFAASQWEKSKMDSLAWSVIKNAFITGDHYLYCFDERRGGSLAEDKRPRLRMRSIRKTNVYLADEQNPEIDEQEYIILAERRPVSKIRAEAKKNGLPPEEIEMIVEDEEVGTQIGEEKRFEVDTGRGKCLSLLLMRKSPDGIAFSRATRYCVYEPERTVKGLERYPLVGMRWEEQIGSARGVSGVEYLIPNQLVVNKTAARRAIAVKRFSFPTLAYDRDAVQNIDDLSKVGASIAIQNISGNPIGSLIQYLNPAPISGDAQALQAELVQTTRELEGAGDAATGQVDPTKASGEAIKAVRDQAAVPLNEQIAAYKQFVEDIALLWFDMWVAYSPNGLHVEYERQGEQVSEDIDAELLRGMEVNIKIDVSPVDPYSKVAAEITLQNLLTAHYIEFEEYVKALDDSAGAPKAKLEQILREREGGIPQELLDVLRQNPELLQYVMQMVGQAMQGGQTQNGQEGVIG